MRMVNKPNIPSIFINSEKLSELTVKGRTIDMKQWNKIQIDLMTDLAKIGKVDLSDMSIWMKFGEFFYNYVTSHSMEVPSLKTIILNMRL